MIYLSVFLLALFLGLLYQHQLALSISANGNGWRILVHPFSKELNRLSSMLSSGRLTRASTDSFVRGSYMRLLPTTRGEKNFGVSGICMLNRHEHEYLLNELKRIPIYTIVNKRDEFVFAYSPFDTDANSGYEYSKGLIGMFFFNNDDCRLYLEHIVASNIRKHKENPLGVMDPLPSAKAKNCGLRIRNLTLAEYFYISRKLRHQYYGIPMHMNSYEKDNYSTEKATTAENTEVGFNKLVNYCSSLFRSSLWPPRRKNDDENRTQVLLIPSLMDLAVAMKDDDTYANLIFSQIKRFTNSISQCGRLVKAYSMGERTNGVNDKVVYDENINPVSISWKRTGTPVYIITSQLLDVLRRSLSYKNISQNKALKDSIVNLAASSHSKATLSDHTTYPRLPVFFCKDDAITYAQKNCAAPDVTSPASLASRYYDLLFDDDRSRLNKISVASLESVLNAVETRYLDVKLLLIPKYAIVNTSSGRRKGQLSSDSGLNKIDGSNSSKSNSRGGKTNGVRKTTNSGSIVQFGYESSSINKVFRSILKIKDDIKNDWTHMLAGYR